MLSHRILTAVVVLPIFLYAVIDGGLWWLSIIALLVTIGTRESSRLAAPGRPFVLFFSLALAYSWVILAYRSTQGHISLEQPLSTVVILCLLIVATVAMMVQTGNNATKSYKPTLFDRFVTIVAAGMYPGLFFALLLLLRAEGLYFLLLAAIVTWTTDTAAYFVGRRFGKRPLSRKISPNKTMEGAVGGLVFASILGTVFAYLTGMTQGRILLFALLSLATSAIAQSGDLYESALKRKAGVKDSGTFLPGHGGVLDRFDSLFFAAATVYIIHSSLG